ncbi:VOC family protein [Halobacillus salinarum]|uniref:VOC family protein n=1 Tax=Halobacillus salinarum TaxID=2932257 RepID=A0ABY4EKV7_9BACI|nr:VOC family protein [Halobacillus salinarum]UOQ44728.1 VOC family protein [Halobacillus salinarum]
MTENNPMEKPNEIKLAPWLSVDNASIAMSFYKEAFMVSEQYLLRGDDGSPVIAQLSFGGAEFWIQEDPVSSPDSEKQGSVRMIITVQNPDSMFERALTAGAIEISSLKDEHGWRVGRIEDPFGHHWEIGRQLSS